MNPAYKHLRDRLRFGELTVPQIVGIFGGLMLGLVFAMYLSPFGAYVTLAVSIYIGCIPAGTVLLATSTEFDLWLFCRAVVREALTDGRYQAGPGESFTGYEITPEVASEENAAGGLQPLDLEEIWAK